MHHWVNFWYLARHKYWVFVFGLKLGVPIWRLIVHDLDKFWPPKWKGYANYYFNPNKQFDFTSKFNYACNGHQKLAKHHWQYWILIDNFADLIPLEIPDVFIKEMIADWLSAAKCKVGNELNIYKWYAENKENLILNKKTRAKLEKLLSEKIH
mgnify:CR=1 FL=1